MGLSQGGRGSGAAIARAHPAGGKAHATVGPARSEGTLGRIFSPSLTFFIPLDGGHARGETRQGLAIGGEI